jgi:hypothetical protein
MGCANVFITQRRKGAKEVGSGEGGNGLFGNDNIADAKVFRQYALARTPTWHRTDGENDGL